MRLTAGETARSLLALLLAACDAAGNLVTSQRRGALAGSEQHQTAESRLRFLKAPLPPTTSTTHLHQLYHNGTCVILSKRLY